MLFFHISCRISTYLVAFVQENIVSSATLSPEKHGAASAFADVTRYVTERVYPPSRPWCASPGGHLEVMRLVLSHFLSVLPDIMSARAHE